MGDRTDGQTNGRTNKRMKERTNKQTNEQIERFSYDLEKRFQYMFVVCFIRHLKATSKRSKRSSVRFPPKETLIWRQHCSIVQSYYRIQADVKKKYRLTLESSRVSDHAGVESVSRCIEYEVCSALFLACNSVAFYEIPFIKQQGKQYAWLVVEP